MSLTQRTRPKAWWIGFAIGTLLAGTATPVSAQCGSSSGNPDGFRNGVRGGINLVSTGGYPYSAAMSVNRLARANYLNSSRMAMQQRMVAARQQQLMRQRMMHRYARDQEKLALRRQRADEKRAKRSERIARMKAERESERAALRDGEMYAGRLVKEIDESVAIDKGKVKRGKTYLVDLHASDFVASFGGRNSLGQLPH